MMPFGREQPNEGCVCFEGGPGVGPPGLGLGWVVMVCGVVMVMCGVGSVW